MNRELAKQIVIKTFENPFDKSNFTKFIANLLKSYDRTKYLPPRSGIQGITQKYLGFIASWERIGRYKDKNDQKIDILIIKLRRGTSLYYARSSQRNFVANYLQGKLGTTTEKNAALCAFISPDEEDWRFSLVKMDYRLEEGKSGRVNAKEEFTPAKRWSFLVGKNEKSHTAQSRFVPLLERDEKPILEELEEAFNVEIVTKEFFEKYRDLFIRTKLELDKIVQKDCKVKEEFESKNVNTVDFAKKLLGQIVFLYFLQKKGWFGVEKEKPWGTGPRDFMRRLFNKEYGDYENFYNDILEPLFYEALRTDRSYADHYYSRFNCKIPFLNGGLFDPINNYDWVNTEITIPDALFSNKRRTKEGDTGDGILDVFDRFNFTVNEEEPLEKEVALDPELLGKIYEKLNAIRPDNFDEYVKVLKSGKKGNETKFNKEYGVYYTPREIVHYMCQESLINYLETELIGKCTRQDIEKFVKFADSIQETEEIAIEKEKKIKSGEQKTTKYESQLPDNIKSNAKEIDKLLADIKVCDPAVGSGAFPIGMMHEIVKLRRLLSLFTGEKKTNYELKRHCIENSLYGVDIDPGAVEICKLRFWLSLIVDEEDIYKIKPLPNLDYKIVCGDSLLGVEENIFNNEAFRNLEELKPKYFNETNPIKKEEIKKEIDKIIFEITRGHKEFDFKVYFSEVFHQKGGFDVIIANPPYGAKCSKEKKKYFLNYFKSAKTIPGLQKGSLDTFSLFIEQGFNILKKHGSLIYIVPISITSSDSMTALHNLLENNCKEIKISSYAVRPQPIFESAVVNTSILFFVKTLSPVEKILCTKMYRKGKGFNLQYLLKNLEFIDVKKYKLRGRYPKISLPIETRILEKLFSLKYKIKDLIRSKGKPIYYRFAGGRYFKVVTNYSTGSSAERTIYFEPKIANCIGAILSSNLFFWFYQIYSDNLNLKSYEIESFPIPLENLTDDKIKVIEKLYEEYLKDIEKNARIRETKKYANIDSFKEYKIGKSKHLIDAIDNFIGPLYGLNYDEIEFIKNYEIEFRLDEEDGDEDI